MLRSEVTKMILEVANPAAFPPRRIQVQCELAEAIRRKNMGLIGSYAWRSGIKDSVFYMMETLYTNAIETDPLSLIGLLPFFHLACCDD